MAKLRKSDKNKKVSCEVEPKEHREITKRADAEGRSVANWIRLLITRELAK